MYGTIPPLLIGAVVNTRKYQLFQGLILLYNAVICILYFISSMKQICHMHIQFIACELCCEGTLSFQLSGHGLRIFFGGC